MHTGQDTAENDVVTVQPSRGNECDEKLRAIGVFTVVGHRYPTGCAVTQQEILIDERLAVDAFAARAVSVQNVSSLYDEISNHTVNW